MCFLAILLILRVAAQVAAQVTALGSDGALTAQVTALALSIYVPGMNRNADETNAFLRISVLSGTNFWGWGPSQVRRRAGQSRFSEGVILFPPPQGRRATGRRGAPPEKSRFQMGRFLLGGILFPARVIAGGEGLCLRPRYFLSLT